MRILLLVIVVYVSVMGLWFFLSLRYSTRADRKLDKEWKDLVEGLPKDHPDEEE